MTRREMLRQSGTGFGMLALSALLQEQGKASDQAPHVRGRAKSVIFLFMDGGVSHVDTFDPKPALEKYSGQPWTGDPTR